MKKRRLVVWGFLAVAALAGAVALALFFRPQPHINKETLEQIKPGMTEKEVEHLIGGPPGKYCDFEPTDTRVQQVKGDHKKQWVGNDGIICVGYSDGKVVGKGWGSVTGSVPKPTWWEKLKQRLGI